MKSKLICEGCGRVFVGIKAHRCPECLKKLCSERAKKTNLNRLGNEAYSKLCAERRAHANE